MTDLPTDVFEYARWLCERLHDAHRDDPVVTALTSDLRGVLEQIEFDADRLRERTEESLAIIDGERERYVNLFEAAPDPYVVTGHRGIVLEHNRRAAELLGVTRGRPFVLSVVADDRAAFYRFMGGEDGPGRTTLRFDTSSGPVVMDIQCTELGLGGVLWLLRDITQIEFARKQEKELAERSQLVADELRELNEIRGAFLMTVSHDLRTPLAAVAGLAETLADHPELPEQDRRWLVGQIHDTAKTVLGLFTDLLDVERIERKDVVVRRRQVDMQELVTKAVAAADLGARVVDVAAEACSADVDAVLVGRIVDNLLRNVATHTPPDARVWVKCHREPDGVLLIVEDDGPGVPPELGAKVFDLFGRSRRSHAGPGLGVGLTLVRRFAELHGGWARVHNRPGGGASFHVLLPSP